MTILIETDPSQIDLFQSALGGAAAAATTLAAADAALAENPHEFAVVVGPSVRDAEAYAFSEQWRVRRPSLSVVLVRHRVDRQVLTEALRAGMREVVEARDLAEVANAVGRAHQLHTAMATPESDAAARGVGRVVTVFSNKGGVGKTTVSTNLAAALAHQGQAVCLVDADVASGDVALMLHLFPTKTLGDLPQLRGMVDRTGVATLVVEHSPGLSVLAAPLGVAEADGLSAEHFGQVLEVLRSMYDVVIVDTAPAFDDFALPALDVADRILLVGTLDMLSLKNLKLAVQTLDLLGVEGDRVQLVLNREENNVGLSAKDFAETMGREPVATLPSSREVLLALNQGQALVLTAPRHPISKALTSLARRLVSELMGEQATSEGSPERRALFSLRRGAR